VKGRKSPVLDVGKTGRCGLGAVAFDQVTQRVEQILRCMCDLNHGANADGLGGCDIGNGRACAENQVSPSP
jgi:hypothetical protein